MKYSPGDIFLRLAGGNMVGDINLANEDYLTGLDSLAVARILIGRMNTNHTVVGDGINPIRLYTTADIMHWAAGTDYSIWSERHLLYRVKASDETINNSDVLQNDDDLVFPVGANERWAVIILFKSTATAVADHQIDFTLPVAAVMSGWFEQRNVTVPGTFDAGVPFTFAGMGVAIHGMIFAQINTGANAGNVQMQWAQLVAEVSDCSVLEGSWLIAMRIE